MGQLTDEQYVFSPLDNVFRGFKKLTYSGFAANKNP